MPINTKYDPQHSKDFQKGLLNKDAKGQSGTVIAGSTTSFDMPLQDDMLITGGVLLSKNANQGDKVHFQIVHSTYGVIAQYVTDWFINPEVVEQRTPSIEYPAKLQAGLILRLVYVSTGQNDVWVAINYDREKVLE